MLEYNEERDHNSLGGITSAEVLQQVNVSTFELSAWRGTYVAAQPWHRLPPPLSVSLTGQLEKKKPRQTRLVVTSILLFFLAFIWWAV